MREGMEEPLIDFSPGGELQLQEGESHRSAKGCFVLPCPALPCPALPCLALPCATVSKPFFVLRTLRLKD